MYTRRELANAIRALSMDAVQRANSGHPGAPMGMADIAEVFWRDFLIHNPSNPQWVNRDRFVISNGHASMLLYSLLHLTGYDLTIEDIKNFRQLHAKTPGHPEYQCTPGIETTTGPLGQGLANAVGMAIAEKNLAANFNRPHHNIIDHRTWVFLGDGCLMEGISHEVCSLAGTYGLGKLIVFYDDNGISIDGPVKEWFSDDTETRFKAYHWQVIPDVDGHNSDAIQKAITSALENTNQPSLICCKTTIGFGSPNKSGTASVHGSPLGEEEIKLSKKQLNWPHPAFEIPKEMYAAWDGKHKGNKAEIKWNEQFTAYAKAHPKLATELERRLQKELPSEFTESANEYILQCQKNSNTIASRKASQNALDAYAPYLPELLGGSADLTGSNLTLSQESTPVTQAQPGGNYIYYGVREFGMSAIMNGIALHGGFIPYGGTFLVFMEYACNAIRMASLMKTHTIFVYTHDSIGVGEDGPTHQPIEQLASLRLTPNLKTWRPCDTVESAVAWRHALTDTQGPSALVFSRQALPCMARDNSQVTLIERGGYILKEGSSTPDLILIATGSEVSLAVAAADELTSLNYSIRVVSMPCTEIFDAQDAEYKQQVLPSNITLRIAIEAGIPDFWYKYVGLSGRILGMPSFGDSAPAKDLFPHFGFSQANLVSIAKELLM